MRTYPLILDDGSTYAFEVPSSIGRRLVVRAIARIPGVEITRRPRFFSWTREDSFCEFILDGVNFEVEEPFGDNSRFWIGPLDREPHDATVTLLDELARTGRLGGRAE